MQLDSDIEDMFDYRELEKMTAPCPDHWNFALRGKIAVLNHIPGALQHFSTHAPMVKALELDSMPGALTIAAAWRKETPQVHSIPLPDLCI